MKAEAKRARRIAAKDAPPVVYDTEPEDDEASVADDDASNEDPIDAVDS
ncbi:hypothetical protein CA51_28090 [Rosistilla oblonga]|uniref:Uncharacterized protein n=2 Tax=Rosistilla oblonga TaxID=2527990 RepID=A0A518J0P2_9BACT|nr:hypothetical protein [Rosistilla oblonga]QDV12923.1 hypothetical protein CA51_28090 [Rosistilla oblonga]QDV58913.1 hypothetical protein Mal33_49380 [Rosistilla oblonga]